MKKVMFPCIFIICFLCVFCSSASALVPVCLKGTTVLFLVKDNDSLWCISGDRLMRCDLKNNKHEKFDVPINKDDRVICLENDARAILIGTNSSGLFRFDKAQKKFSQFQLDGSKFNMAVLDYVTSIVPSDKNIYFTTLGYAGSVHTVMYIDSNEQVQNFLPQFGLESLGLKESKNPDVLWMADGKLCMDNGGLLLGWTDKIIFHNLFTRENLLVSFNDDNFDIEDIKASARMIVAVSKDKIRLFNKNTKTWCEFEAFKNMNKANFFGIYSLSLAGDRAVALVYSATYNENAQNIIKDSELGSYMLGENPGNYAPQNGAYLALSRQHLIVYDKDVNKWLVIDKIPDVLPDLLAINSVLLDGNSLWIGAKDGVYKADIKKILDNPQGAPMLEPENILKEEPNQQGISFSTDTLEAKSLTPVNSQADTENTYISRHGFLIRFPKSFFLINTIEKFPTLQEAEKALGNHFSILSYDPDLADEGADWQNGQFKIEARIERRTHANYEEWLEMFEGISNIYDLTVSAGVAKETEENGKFGSILLLTQNLQITFYVYPYSDDQQNNLEEIRSIIKTFDVRQ